MFFFTIIYLFIYLCLNNNSQFIVLCKLSKNILVMQKQKLFCWPFEDVSKYSNFMLKNFAQVILMHCCLNKQVLICI